MDSEHQLLSSSIIHAKEYAIGLFPRLNSSIIKQDSHL